MSEATTDDGRPTTEDATPPTSAVGRPSSTLGPCRLHWSWIVLGAVPMLRAVALPLVVLLATGGPGREIAIYGAAIGTALLGTALRVVSWWTFRYEVTEGELRVRSGVLSRREQFVPVGRIHAVDLDESLLQRVFGVVRVKIETAAGGSSDSDVTLAALSRRDAETLRSHLDAVGRTSTKIVDESADAQPAPGGRLIRALAPLELLVAGATDGRFGPAVAILFGVYQFVDDLVPDTFWERLTAAVPGFSFRGALLLILAIVLISWLLTVVSTVLTFAGFELRRDGDRLQVSHGLLDRRRSTIPLTRVQAVVISEGILRQPFGLAAVRIESAGYGKDRAESGVLFPLLRRAEVSSLLAAACPDFVVDPDAPLAPLPARARQRYVVEQARGTVILTAFAVLATTLLPRAPWWWGLALATLVPVAMLHGLLRFQDTGWALDDSGRLVVRGRGIGRVTTITSQRRLQHREVSRHVLQRRASLATFRAAFASGGSGGHIMIKHLDDRVADDLLAKLMPARPTDVTSTH